MYIWPRGQWPFCVLSFSGSGTQPSCCCRRHYSRWILFLSLWIVFGFFFYRYSLCTWVYVYIQVCSILAEAVATLQKFTFATRISMHHIAVTMFIYSYDCICVCVNVFYFGARKNQFLTFFGVASLLAWIINDKPITHNRSFIQCKHRTQSEDGNRLARNAFHRHPFICISGGHWLYYIPLSSSCVRPLPAASMCISVWLSFCSTAAIPVRRSTLSSSYKCMDERVYVPLAATAALAWRVRLFFVFLVQFFFSSSFSYLENEKKNVN